MAAGFTINADDALRLATDIARKRAALLPKIHAETVKAGRQMQALTRSGMRSSTHNSYTRKVASSFYTKTKRSANGTEVTIETKNALGAIIVFGTSVAGPHKNTVSGPHDSPGAALESVLPSWEKAISDAAAEVI